MTGEGEKKLRDYLSFGFIPDARLASDYLNELFGAAAKAGPTDPSKLLIEIVADLTNGASDVVIPLSGGRDSRALLGAALHAFPNRNIHCITFGSEGSEDVEGAKVACAGARVSHQLVDPDTLEWNLDELTDEMEKRSPSGRAFPQSMACWCSASLRN